MWSHGGLFRKALWTRQPLSIFHHSELLPRVLTSLWVNLIDDSPGSSCGVRGCGRVGEGETKANFGGGSRWSCAGLNPWHRKLRSWPSWKFQCFLWNGPTFSAPLRSFYGSSHSLTILQNTFIIIHLYVSMYTNYRIICIYCTVYYIWYNSILYCRYLIYIYIIDLPIHWSIFPFWPQLSPAPSARLFKSVQDHLPRWTLEVPRRAVHRWGGQVKDLLVLGARDQAGLKGWGEWPEAFGRSKKKGTYCHNKKIWKILVWWFFGCQQSFRVILGDLVTIFRYFGLISGVSAILGPIQAR